MSCALTRTRPLPCCAIYALGQPKFYHDIKLALFGRDGEEEVKTYDIVTRLNLQKVLDRRGCDAVQDPRSMAWVDFAAIQLQDGMLLRARSDFFPIDLRVGFDASWWISMCISCFLCHFAIATARLLLGIFVACAANCASQITS